MLTWIVDLERGMGRIIVKHRKIHYDFQLTGKLTVVLGDSATGKSVFVETLRKYSYTCLEGFDTVKVMYGIDAIPEDAHNTLIICDLDSTMNKEIVRRTIALNNTTNAFLFFGRSYLNEFPVSVDDLYVLSKGNPTKLKAAYPKELYKVPAHYKDCLVEDSGSGLQFWSKALGNAKSSNGISNFSHAICNDCVCIFDRVGAGAYIDAILYASAGRRNVTLLDYQCFEAFLLSTLFHSEIDVHNVLYKEKRYYKELQEYVSNTYSKKGESLGNLCKDPVKVVRNSRYSALVQTDYITLYKSLSAEEKEKLRKDYPTVTDILVREDISAIEDVSFILQSIFGR